MKELTLKFLATTFEEQRNGGLAVGTKLNNTKVKRVLKTPETESQNSKAKKSCTKLETVAKNNKAQNTITNLQPEIKDLETESHNSKQKHIPAQNRITDKTQNRRQKHVS